MNQSRVGWALWAVMILSAGVAAAAPSTCEPWQKPYGGADATGPHVIGLWQFKAGAEMKDSSPNGHELKLEGASIEPKGLFGPCLESFIGYPIEDKRHAAVAPNRPALTPKGAFTLELWLRPKEELAKAGEAFLIDKMYASHTGYQLTVGAPDKAGQRRLTARLGFGDDVAAFNSEPAEYAPGTWHHVAFTYDGASEGRFYRDGATIGGGSQAGRGAVAPGAQPLSIGDRGGSIFHGFPGYLAQVRLCSGMLEFRPARIALAPGRTVFVRMEKGATARVEIANLQRESIVGAKLTLSLDGRDSATTSLPELAAGQRHVIEFPIDTALRPDEYRLRARIEIPGAKTYVSEESFAIRIVPRPLPERMPVVMWGVYSPDRVVREMGRLKEIGFTHCLGLSADYDAIWKAKAPIEPGKPEEIARTRRMLDAALANDLGIIASLAPGASLKGHEELLRVGPDGKPHDAKRPDVCALTPGLDQFCYNVGASVARAYGDYPAFQSALLHSEVRDAANLCFHQHDRDAYRKASGQEIPDGLTSKAGVKWEKVAGFPKDRIIADDHPILGYLRWFWKEGDGWNALNTAVHNGLKSTGRGESLWTFHDPAVRVASTYGSGGAVDVISQWTYSYPDPIRIGMATDELFAMAGGAAHRQQVMSMTQIIWYRSQTAPAGADRTTTRSPWEDYEAGASFITIAPMHLREAFWSKISRPVRGIMYHGWESLVETDSTGAYRYTNPQTQNELRRLVKEVVEPLGPTLLHVPDRPSDVAFLESFAAQMFAGRGTYGWNTGWAGDAYHVLQYAQLQPQIVYDETVIAHGLDHYRLLFMLDCDVVTQGVAKAVRDFQRKGGMVVGDERLAPGIHADVTLTSMKRTGNAASDREALLAKAKELRGLIDQKYRRYVESDNPNVIVRDRAYGSTDYVFVVNDLREPGDYVGQYGKVMENGLASEATVRTSRGPSHVYDLVEHREMKSADDGAIRVTLGPCDGRVFMLTRQAIDHVRVEAPQNAKMGGAITCKMAVEDEKGHAIDAVLPVRVEVHDSQGRLGEFSGYYGAKDGRSEIRLDVAANDSPGTWEIRTTELASGSSATCYVRVTRP